ncbi:MAG TPA: anti-sigma factor RsbA family regulatory protein [Acidimicrobiales bacterium]|nr:anti-sigma factor RsbA family regulatory protein [Acidimicrobiales bacterium]
MADPSVRENERDSSRPSQADHALLLHQGDGSCVDGLRAMLPPQSESAAVLAVVTPETYELIGSAFDRFAAFADMSELGRNPARVIPVIRQFVETHGRGRRVVVVTEQWWDERQLARRAELARNEALTNLAFGGKDVDLVCLYDTRQVNPELVADAKRTHPLLVDADGIRPNPWFVDPHEMLEQTSAPFDPAPSAAETFAVEAGHLAELRASVGERGHRAGLSSERVEDLVLAANEVATNVVSHGEGRGRLRLWTEDAWLVCEVTDRGHVEDPFVGTRNPPTEGTSGRGLWMVNQLCDFVEMRSAPGGTSVRLRFARPASAVSVSPV